jgi:hypothetical protein
MRTESDSPVQRLARMLWFFHAGAAKYEPLYSLIRRDVLAATGRIRPIVYNDYVLVAELSLAGRFTHVPEVLFHRRWRTPTDRRVLCERLIPGRRETLAGSWATMVRELLATIRQAPLSRGERLRGYGTAGRYFGREALELCRMEAARLRRERLGLTRERMRRLVGPKR